MDRFECFFHPRSRAGVPIPNESGELPSVIVDAADSKAAAAAAKKQVGHPITETVRIAEDVAAPPKSRKPRAKKQAALDLAALGVTTADKLEPR
jgi:hypothetical protein